ncbi:uncharacterized protein ACJ7VT_020742 isoform 2-T2 [Polymixia lowei]
MNLVQNRSVHPHLRDEEAVVIENAIRIAIDSILNVLYGVDSARTNEYQRMVADRDKEIRRLEGRSEEMESELRVLRRGCACRLFEHSLDSSGNSGDPRRGEEEEGGSFEPSICVHNDMTPEQECEMSISCLFARPPSRVSSQSHKSAPPLSPNTTGLEQTFTSASSEASGVSDGTRNLSTSPSSLTVKEEPSDIDTVLIKWEMSEQSFSEHPASIGTSCEDNDSPCIQGRLGAGERIKTFRDILYAEPDRHHAHKEGQRLSKKTVPMSELPEEAQRLKRAAWRAASRRYYARKVARLQTGPAQTGLLPQNTDSPCSLPISFGDPRRKTLISELPEDTQTMQREAWRVASRRYYARKMARLQADPTQLAHLLQNTDTPNRDGSHGNRSGLEGVICS